jgi:predicted nuclease with TOPRIM domain
MAERLKQLENDKKPLKENSLEDKNISSSLKKRHPELPSEITNEQWEKLISMATQRNASFISISKKLFHK